MTGKINHQYSLLNSTPQVLTPERTTFIRMAELFGDCDSTVNYTLYYRSLGRLRNKQCMYAYHLEQTGKRIVCHWQKPVRTW